LNFWGRHDSKMCGALSFFNRVLVAVPHGSPDFCTEILPRQYFSASIRTTRQFIQSGNFGTPATHQGFDRNFGGNAFAVLFVIKRVFDQILGNLVGSTL